MISVGAPIDADALRIRHEFLMLPDLRTSIDACAHALCVSHRQAAHILESLVQDGFLQRTSDGNFVRIPSSFGRGTAPPS